MLAATLVVLCCPLLAAAPAFADATRDGQWYARTLRYEQLHAVSKGAGVTVAVIDTGVDASHPDLVDNVLPGLDGWSAQHDGRTDAARHGTGVAALIAGHGHGSGGRDGVLGIAPEAKILPVGAVPRGYDTFLPADLATGIRWAVDHGADVICMAIGGGSDPAIADSVSYALDHGVTLVAAAGNRPRDHSLTFPAAYPGVIAVSATGRSGEFAADVSVAAWGVLLSAPGVEMVSAAPGGGYATDSGTSYATALVAGAAALVRARWPQLTGAGVYQQLKATAVDGGQPGYDDQYGYGAIDPLGAVSRQPGTASAVAQPPPTGPAATPDLAGGRSTGTKLLLSVLLIGGWLLVIAVLVLVVRWLVRRARRRGRARLEAPGPEPGDPPPTPHATDEDTAWRRPGRS